MYHSLNYDTRGKTVSQALDGVPIDSTSKGWLIQNLDPFHDNAFPLCAPPTPSMLDSVVQCRRVRVNITPSPEGEIHLFFPPIPFATPLYYDFPTDPFNYGGIMQWKDMSDASNPGMG